MSKKRRGRSISLTDNYQVDLVYETQTASHGLRIRLAREGKRSLIDVHLDSTARAQLLTYLGNHNCDASLSGPAKINKVTMDRV